MERRGTCRECGEEDVAFQHFGNFFRSLCRSCYNADCRRRMQLYHQRKRTGTKLPFGQPCACCQQPMQRPALDHDHATGAIREWICQGDNTALGQRRDDPLAFLEAAEQATARAARFSGERQCEELDRAIRNLQRAGYLLKHRA